MFPVKTFSVACVLAVSTCASPSAAAAPSRALAAASLQRLVDGLVRDGAPGAIAVVRTTAGVRRVQGGVARSRPRLPMAAMDRFRVASVTKSFVATIVLELVAEGKLRLDDTVERRLPGLLPDGRTITIRELLDHTSGLREYEQDAPFVRAVIAHPGRTWPPRKLVAIATAHGLLFPPGSNFYYANTNYIVLGLIAEAVTGTPLGRLLERRLFGPLGLEETSFPTGTGMDGPYAHGYIGFATLPRLHSLLDASVVESNSVAWSAGGIVSTADDVTRFYEALLGGRLLPLRLLTAMETPSARASYGLGLLVVQTRCGRAYGHEGVATGYRTVVYANRRGTRVALVMVNIDNTYVAQHELEAAAETALCSG
jgi:D-alanyl-D-alanine carboxypeptidase